MSFAREWNEVLPTDEHRADQIAEIIRNLKTDVRERLEAALGITNFADQNSTVIKGKKLYLNNEASSFIVIGTDALYIVNNAENANLVIVRANGAVELTGTLQVNGGMLNTTFNGNIFQPQQGGRTAIFENRFTVQNAQARQARLSLGAKNGNFSHTWDAGANIALTLDASVVMTMTDPLPGAWYFIEVKQGAGGPFNLTFAPGVVWAGGVAPTLTPTAGKSDFLSLYYNGATYAGFVAGQGYSV